jgi:hypothetical protein
MKRERDYLEHCFCKGKNDILCPDYMVALHGRSSLPVADVVMYRCVQCGTDWNEQEITPQIQTSPCYALWVSEIPRKLLESGKKELAVAGLTCGVRGDCHHHSFKPDHVDGRKGQPSFSTLLHLI